MTDPTIQYDSTDACREGIDKLRQIALPAWADALLTACEGALETVDNVIGDLVACELGEADRGFSQEDCQATADYARTCFRATFDARRQAEASERYPEDDWKYEVANGDTRLGYADWVSHKLESDS